MEWQQAKQKKKSKSQSWLMKIIYKTNSLKINPYSNV